jgi:cytochrome c oxidase subunit IV
MADHPRHTSPVDPADHGHHGHHIIPARVLLTVFGALVFLTILTVVLAVMERGGVVHFGGFGSVAVALFIAGIKATLVAMYFMALKYDNRVNALAFALSIVFLVVFFAFTFLDTGFRGQFGFGALEAQPLDQIRMEQIEAERQNQIIQQRFQEQPVVSPGDTTLLGPAPAVQ